MTSINDKDDVVKLLERLERVSREIKGLPAFAKSKMAVDAGVLETELDELEGLVTQAKDVVEDMHDSDDIGDIDLTNELHRDIVADALESIGALDEYSQIILIERAIKASDCFDANLEGFNSMLQDCKKEWFVIDRSQVTELKNLVDSLGVE